MIDGRTLAKRVLRSLRRLVRWAAVLPVLGPRLRRFGERLLPPGQTEPMRVTRGIARGLVLELNPGTSAAFRQGEVEPEVSDAIQRFAHPGAVFYDLGANMGYFSLSVARLVGPEGRVFAFEADPEMAGRLRKNASRNGLENVTVVEAAVWSSEGLATFERSDPSVSPDRGLGRVVADEEVTGAMVQVPTVALDVFVETSPDPDLIKCDVEGAELEVFEGARVLLARARPVIVCEMHSPEKGERLLASFQGSGYGCTWLDETHLLAEPGVPSTGPTDPQLP